MTTTKPQSYVAAIYAAAVEYSNTDRIRYHALANAGAGIVSLEALKGQTLTTFVTEWASSNPDVLVLNQDGTVTANAVEAIVKATLQASLSSNADSAVAQFKSNAKSSVVIETEEAFEPFRERMTAEILKRIAPELGDVPVAVAYLSEAITMADESAGTSERISVAKAIQKLRKAGGTQEERIVPFKYFVQPLQDARDAIGTLENRKNLTIEQATALLRLVSIAIMKKKVDKGDDVQAIRTLEKTIETLTEQVA